SVHQQSGDPDWLAAMLMSGACPDKDVADGQRPNRGYPGKHRERSGWHPRVKCSHLELPPRRYYWWATPDRHLGNVLVFDAHGLNVETFRAGLGELQHYGAGHVVCVLHGNGVALKHETKAFFGESAWVCPQNQALTFADLRAVTPAK
ncbi:MAG TPA: hypothetical protein PLP17_15165, partial [Oligoflexia bacterium]|nr:hypothetical protein [Oligoflexia bacterium]